MAKQAEPRYKLKRRSDNYVGLWDGKHCLAAICTKKPRGLLDARSLLTAMNSYEALLGVCNKISRASKAGTSITEYLGELEAAIENAK